MDNPRYYMVNEFAKLAGVTVRTLHFYDREGLLKPSQYTGKKHRLYAQSDLLRLQQITTLKHLGFSLKEIRDVLENPGYNVRESLRIQKEAIDRRILQMQAVSYALSRTLEKADSVDDIDWKQVTTIIQGLSDADKNEWMQRYYPPEQAELWKWVHERAVQMPPDDVLAGVKAWENVYAEFRQVMHLAPDDPQVQALAAQAVRLGEGFTQGNPELEQMLEQMYSETPQIPEAYRLPQFDQALQDFMYQAMTIYRSRRDKS